MLECPKCGKLTLETFALNYPEGSVLIFACKNCGFQGHQSPEEIKNIKPAKPKTEQKKPELEPKEHRFRIRESKSLKLRKQNPNCNEKGRMCITLDGKPTCLSFKFEDSKFKGFDLKKCKKDKGEKS
jgi:Zn ribbon nucleic-acid-binding protein